MYQRGLKKSTFAILIFKPNGWFRWIQRQKLRLPTVSRPFYRSWLLRKPLLFTFQWQLPIALASATMATAIPIGNCHCSISPVPGGLKCQATRRFPLLSNRNRSEKTRGLHRNYCQNDIGCDLEATGRRVALSVLASCVCKVGHFSSAPTCAFRYSPLLPRVFGTVCECCTHLLMYGGDVGGLGW